MNLQQEVYIPTDTGHFISDKHMRIAELIREYDENIDLKWIPADKRAVGEPPFCLTSRQKDGKEYVICYADELDERLLARLYQMDQNKGNPLSQMDAHNAAIKAVQQREWEEAVRDQADFMSTVIRSPLHTFKHNGRKYE